jgi:transposase-like protein
MRKSKFTESQIVVILAQHESGQKVVDICREHGISQHTFYQWQRKYSGMEVNDHCEAYPNGPTVLHLSKKAIQIFQFPRHLVEKIANFTAIV